MPARPRARTRDPAALISGGYERRGGPGRPRLLGRSQRIGEPGGGAAGRSGLGWLGAGAQAVRVITWNSPECGLLHRRTAPCKGQPPGAAWRAGSAICGAAGRHWSRPSRADRASAPGHPGRCVIVSASTTGSARPARCSRRPHPVYRRKARPGLAPASSAISASAGTTQLMQRRAASIAAAAVRPAAGSAGSASGPGGRWSNAAERLMTRSMLPGKGQRLLFRTTGRGPRRAKPRAESTEITVASRPAARSKPSSSPSPQPRSSTMSNRPLTSASRRRARRTLRRRNRCSVTEAPRARDGRARRRGRTAGSRRECS